MNGPGTPPARRRAALAAAVAVACAFVWLQYGDGTDSRVLVHDNLDSNLPNRVAFARSDALFADARAEFAPFLGGLPRGFMPSEFFVPMLLYRWLDPFVVFVVQELAMRIVGVLGMWLLLAHHLLRGRPPAWIAGLSLCFGLLPFFPTYGLSVAGQPLLAWAFLSLRRDPRSVPAWLVILLFPLFTNLVLAGLFLLLAAATFWLVDACRSRALRLPFLGGIALLAGGYLATEYRLLWTLLSGGGGPESHRSEFLLQRSSLGEALELAGYNALHGQYHVESHQLPVIGAVVLVATVCTHLAARRRSGGAADDRAGRALGRLWGLVGLALAISLWHGLWQWRAIPEALAALDLGLLALVNLGRLNWLHPILWCVVLALGVDRIRRDAPLGPVLAAGFVAVHLLVLVNASLERQREQGLGFRAYFAPGLFAEIAEHIDRPLDSFRVGSVGLHPAIALYHGFSTIDGYHYNYELAHKRAFRKVIAGELDRDEGLRSYYDEWGSRCYLFTRALGREMMFTADHPVRAIDDVAFDVEALAALGTAYLLSAVELRGVEARGLVRERVFANDEAAWEIHLYRVDPAADARLAGPAAP